MVVARYEDDTDCELRHFHEAVFRDVLLLTSRPIQVRGPPFNLFLLRVAFVHHGGKRWGDHIHRRGDADTSL